MKDFRDLDLKDSDKMEEIEARLKEKLGLGLNDLKQALGDYVKNKSESLALDFMNIAPYGDYGKLMDEKGKMASFLTDEASKPENWKISMVQVSQSNKSLLEFMFKCSAVDDGETLNGFAYVSLSGKIKHVYAQHD